MLACLSDIEWSTIGCFQHCNRLVSIWRTSLWFCKPISFKVEVFNNLMQFLLFFLLIYHSFSFFFFASLMLLGSQLGFLDLASMPIASSMGNKISRCMKLPLLWLGCNLLIHILKENKFILLLLLLLLCWSLLYLLCYLSQILMQSKLLWKGRKTRGNSEGISHPYFLYFGSSWIFLFLFCMTHVWVRMKIYIM